MGKSLVIRAGLSVYVGFGIIVGVIEFISLLGDYRTGILSIGSVLPVMVMFLFFLWPRGFKIEVTDKQIIYSNILKTSSLLLSDVEKVFIDARSTKYKGKAKPFIALIILPKQGVNKPPIMINMKVFKREGLITIQKMLKVGPIVVD
jgi:hypothetical protein